MTAPNSLFLFRIGECGVGEYEYINTPDWVMVSCLNGRKTFVWFQLKTNWFQLNPNWFQIKTKELTIAGGKIKVRTFRKGHKNSKLSST